MTYKTGNFAFYEGDKFVIIGQQQSKVEPIFLLCRVEAAEGSSAIVFARESELTSYKRKPNNQDSAKSMTEKQAKVVRIIEENLRVEFNGKMLEDVSVFIDMFLEESKRQYQLDKRNRESRYDGLDGFDLFHG